MIRSRLVLLACAALLAATLTPATASASAPTTDPGHGKGLLAKATQALDQVEDLLQPSITTPGGVPADGDPTLALRDLALLKDALPAEEQARAASYLARPTASPRNCPDYSCYSTDKVHRVCSPALCVHYVRRRDDAKNGVPSGDQDGDGRPNYVEKVLASMNRVHHTYVAAGYRRPMRDGERGGDGRPDIYLAQIGNQGLYGYCTTDAPTVPQHGGVWAYCVLDNDYSHREFPLNTPVENMQVTGAHEYFHAVQFGYDIGEDAWLMEATAVWMEDEVFDRVNDNVGYLPYGPMGRPHISLDSSRNGYWYGAWIFFRHLTERFRASDGGLPTLVRAIWRYADAAGAGSENLYSMAAVQRALADRGTSVGNEYLRMAADNLHPRRSYDEGRRYPATRATTLRVSPDQSHAVSFDLDHLTSDSFRLEPRRTGPRWQLEIHLDLGPVDRGSAALVRVLLESGRVRTSVPTLSDGGDFTGTYAFAVRKVKAVEVTVVNGSTRYNCNASTGWSCRGRPLDQNTNEHLTVRAVRS